MTLSAQMLRELFFMDGRITDIYNEAVSDYPMNYQRTLEVYREEVNAYKVKLEIFFSDTDIKE